jgi:hypothetical protein
MAIGNEFKDRTRRVAAAVAAAVPCLVAAAGIVAAQQRAAEITCTNPASGTSWQVVIDYGKATVDTNPAGITQAKITWFDPKDGGNYTLDRQSGALTASVASSTGGYFRRAHCTQETSR